jgi:TP901 family phage tail tape measure protein
MAVGYEARARITADASGFVSAQQQMEAAANATAAAIQRLDQAMQASTATAAQMATAMRPMVQAQGQVNQVQQQAVSASQAAAQAAQQGAAAYNAATIGAQMAAQAIQQSTQAAQQSVQVQRRSAQSLTQMGQQMVRLADQRRVLVEQQRQQGSLNRSEQEALVTIRRRLSELGREYAALSTEQRRVVDGARQMAQAQSTVRQSMATMSRDIRQAVTDQARQSRQAQQTERDLEALGRRLNTLRRDHDQYRASIAAGAQLNRDQQESFNQLGQTINQLTARFIQLSAQERQVVTSSRELAQAARFARDAMQELDAAEQRLNRTGALTQGQMRTLATDLNRVRSQREALMAIQSRSGQLSSQEAAALRSVSAELQRLEGLYGRLSAAQRAAVDSFAGLAQVPGVLRQTTAEMNAQERAARQLENSHWAWRSALEDVSFVMGDVWQTTVRATQALWDNYAAQTTAIAQISRVSQATAIELRNITDEVRQMSTEIPIAFAELGEIAMLGSQVGVADTALADFTQTVALFAATSEASAAEASTLFARIMEMGNIPDEEIMNLGSAVAYLGSNSAATDPEILKTIESIATMTTQAGFSRMEMIALGGAMASLRIQPEIARGASQRVFLQLSQAVDESGMAMSRLTELTGKSQEELRALRDDNFGEFFFTILEGLNGLEGGVQNMIPTLRELGILNTRDAEVVARLAANYDLLSKSVDDTATAYADGNYLFAESDRIFETLPAKVEILRNTWNNFLYSIMDTVAPAISAMVEFATVAVQAMDDSPVLTQIVAWGLFGAAVASSVAGTIALLAKLGTGIMAIRGVMQLFSDASQRAAISQGVATTAMAAGTTATTANTAATAANTTAQNAGILARIRAAAANSASAASSAAASAAATAQAAAVGRLGVSATGASAAMARLGVSTAAATAASRAFVATPFGAALTAIVGIVAVAAVAFSDLGESTEEANAKLMDLHETHTLAAGGMNALRQAVTADTAAWRANGDAAALRTEAVREMSAEDRAAAEEARALADAQQSLKNQLDPAGVAARNAAAYTRSLEGAMTGAAAATHPARGAVQDAANAMDDMSSAADRSTVAIGAAQFQWAALSLESAALESGILDSSEAFERFRDTGVDLGKAVALEMQEAGQGVEYLNRAAQELSESAGYLEQDWNRVVLGIDATGEKLPGVAQLFAGLLPDSLATDTGETAESLRYLAENLEVTTLSMEQARTQTELFGDELIRLPDGTAATVDEVGALAEEVLASGDAFGAAAGSAAIADMEISALGITVSDVREGFASFVDPLSIWNNAMQASGDTLLDVQGGFSSYLDQLDAAADAQMQWGQNLLDLADEVPPHVIAGLTQMGSEGAELVQGLVDATGEEVDRFVELWDQGGSMALDSFSAIFSDFLSMAVSSGDMAGAEFISGLMASVAAGEMTFQEALEEMISYAETTAAEANPELELQMETVDAIQELNNTLEHINELLGGDPIDPITLPGVDDTFVRRSLEETIELFNSTGGGMAASLGEELERGLNALGNPVASAFAADLAEAREQWVSGDIGVDEYVDRVKAILEDAEAVLDLEVDGDEALEDAWELMQELEGAANDTEAIVRPAVMGDTALGEMDALTGNLVLKGQEADATVTPDVEAAPASRQMGEFIAKSEEDAAASEPTLIPVAATTAAMRAMRALVAASRDMARAARPTITPVVNTSTAMYQMRVLMSALRGSATTIYVPVVPYAAGSISKSALTRKDGGWIDGPGGPRTDSVPMWASKGEFVVNARSAAEFAPLLEAINDWGGGSRALAPAGMMDNTRSSTAVGTMTPQGIARAMATAPQMQRAGAQIVVNNTYPQAEPTSVTINRSMSYAQLLEGTSL